MKRFAMLYLLVLMIIPIAGAHSAEQVRGYVAEFSVIGAPNRDELKSALQTLVISRLATSAIQVVDNQSQASLVVKGSYIAFGKVFSIDLLARDSSGRVVARAFQQGEGQDEIIGVVAKATAILAEEIAKKAGPTAPAPVAALPASAPQAGQAAADIVPAGPATLKVTGDVVPAARQAQPEPDKDIVRPPQSPRQSISGKVSKRIPTVMKSLAMGALKPDGARELFMVDGEKLYLCEYGTDFRIIDEVKLGAGVTPLGVDTFDIDAKGSFEAYVTIMRGDELVSQVWTRKGDKLERIATDLEYYFRAIAFGGKQKKLYAQQIGRDRDYYGQVAEVVKNGAKYELKNPLNLPEKANIFNFNRIIDSEGKSLTVLLTDTGFLVVYDENSKELWRSNDKFGGTETHFRRDDQQNQRFTGSSTRMVFLEQRITVTPEGVVIVPQNEGTFVVGNNRDYKKSSVFAFVWTGSALEEIWHTKPAQTYLADYVYVTAKKELVTLDVAAKEGLMEKGASALAVKNLE